MNKPGIKPDESERMYQEDIAMSAVKLIERKPYMKIIRELRSEHIIKVITGMRRCGKSTLLQMFSDELRNDVSGKQIHYYNFEDLETLAIGSMMDIYRHIVSRLQPAAMNYVFLDEPQNIPDFEKMVDSLFIKENVDLYITGSNAKLLSGELATLLTGRYIEIPMLPFSFAEYYQATSTSPNLSKSESLAMFIYHGGIPQAIHLAKKSMEHSNEFVHEILGTVIEKDIMQRHNRTNKAAFEKLLDFILDSTSSLISPRSIANAISANGFSIDKGTVGKYLSYLEEAFLLYKTSRYDIKGKNLLQTLDKYYIVDPAFRKVRLGKKLADDRGHLLENAVYLELRRRNPQVYVGKLKDKEVDFIAVDSNGSISYYQVAYNVTDSSTLERELAPLKAIRDAYPKYLLTADWDVNPVYDGIKKLNVAEWLLGEESSLSR